MIRRIHHVAIGVKRIAEAYGFYRDTLGLPLLREAELADQGVRAALLAAGDGEIELLEPLHGDSGVARFLDKRGEGLHHVCFETPEIEGVLADLAGKSVPLLDARPRRGLAGRIAFLHPRACNGVLVELATPDVPVHGDGAPVRLKRLVIGARSAAASVTKFQSLFGFSEVAINSGPRAMLAVGRGSLLIVPADEVGGTEGMVALSFVADDFTELMRGFDRVGVKAMRGAGEVTVEPESSHGVHLHISRYE